MAENEKDTFFDHFSHDKSTKLGEWFVKSMAQKVYDFAQINCNSSILEIGPGKGEFAKLCVGHDYQAIEPNEEMAAALEKRGVRVARNMVPPIPDFGRGFDFVVMIDVMEHLDTMTAALKLSENVRDILNPKGKFVIISPDYVSWGYYFFLNDFTHNYITTRRRLQNLLVSAGFNEIESRYQSGHIQGLLGVLISLIARRLPFGFLYSLFPESKIIHKLYKLQSNFLRRVLICGEKLT